MSYNILCPYCFGNNRGITFRDDEVLFRSEVFHTGKSDVLPDEYDDIGDFNARYRGPDKEQILRKYYDWEFFTEAPDSIYETFWEKYGGTTEYEPAAELLGIQPYHRRIINPKDPAHQRYLRQQSGGGYFIRDADGMAAQIQLNTGELCERRVCPFCHNPLPGNYGKNKVRFASVIGITGAGKTVYLSQLLRKMKTYAAKVGLTADVNNAGVQNFLMEHSVAANKKLPASTPANRLQQPLFYELARETKEHGRVPETFVLYDVAGEVFRNQDASLVKLFAPFIRFANGILFLIDPMQFETVSGAVADGRILDEPTEVLDVIHNVLSGRSDTKSEIPMAVCISKADTEAVQRVLSDELRRMLLEDVTGEPDGEDGFNRAVFNAIQYNPVADELKQFIRSNALPLAQEMQVNYASYAYFAFTALGCDVREGTDENGKPCCYPVGPVLPKRVEEPLFWLFYRLGYIGTNEPVHEPGKKRIQCPGCGSGDTFELPEGKRTITTGRLFRKRFTVTYECRDCGYKW